MQLKKISLKLIKEFIHERLVKKVEKKILIYIVFVGIATVFWFFNKLDNEFNSTVYYPVRYTNLPKNKVLTTELPSKLKLHVNAYGYSLLKYKLSPMPFPVVINLKDYAGHLNKVEVKYFKIYTRQIKSDINAQLGKDIDLLDVLPDTIAFNFANIVSKKIPVAPKVHLEFAPQCMLEGEITFKPDSVIVKGPQNILDTLNYIYTKPQKFKRLNKQIERNVALKEVDNIELIKKRVIMNLPVSKFTEASITVPINVVNVPDSLRLITFPQKTKVSYMVSLNNYDKVTSSDFIFQVDYNEIEGLLGPKLTIYNKFTSEKVNSVTYSPKIVEYILEKK